MVFSQAGFASKTGGEEEAAWLLSELRWAESTWTKRTSQIAKWIRFCDEDMRPTLPAKEGDLMDYIGFLALEGQVEPQSLPQYISAVSQYHELHQLPSTTRKPLIFAFQKDYRRTREDSTVPVDVLVICPSQSRGRL